MCVCVCVCVSECECVCVCVLLKMYVERLCFAMYVLLQMDGVKESPVGEMTSQDWFERGASHGCAFSALQVWKCRQKPNVSRVRVCCVCVCVCVITVCSLSSAHFERGTNAAWIKKDSSHGQQLFISRCQGTHPFTFTIPFLTSSLTHSFTLTQSGSYLSSWSCAQPMQEGTMAVQGKTVPLLPYGN